jgi:hypothetical protein
METKNIPNINYPENVNGVPVAEIIKAVAAVRFGYVQIIIQDSKVVQIDRLNKTRFDKPDSYDI